MRHHFFRTNHLLQILNAFDLHKGPLDIYLRNYFRNNKSIGAHDRRFISDTLYGIVRWKGLLDCLCKTCTNWQELLECYLDLDPLHYRHDGSMPLHVRVSFPQAFFQLLVSALGEEKAISFCLASNQSAPITLRANTLKIPREELLEHWKEKYACVPCKHSPQGITFEKRENFLAFEEFKKGWFEVQDEASQIVSSLISAEPGQKVLDFCSGSGGKTLAFAPRMQSRGVIYLHDIRDSILEEAKKRLKRAGIQNAQLLKAGDSKLKQLKGKMDWVLVDAPCSGSGTYRRNPDMKWRFSEEILQDLLLKQRVIFQEALAYLKPGGRIVYATCSVLPQENEEQIAYFIKTFRLKLLEPAFQSFPAKGEMDGFFGAVLYWRQLKVGEFANARGGRFASDPPSLLLRN